MKKIVSVMLAFALLFAALPMGAMASQVDEREQMLAKACAAFPEYAAKIVADTCASAFRSAEPRKTSFTETRSISENEFIVYTEYSDGLVALDEVSMEREVIYNSTDDAITAINVDITVKATCSETTAYFKVSNIKFTINTSNYDRITSIGTPTVHNPPISYNDSCSYFSSELSKNLVENSVQKAYVCYPLSFKYAPYGGYEYSSKLWVEVGNNSLSVHHDLWQ